MVRYYVMKAVRINEPANGDGTEWWVFDEQSTGRPNDRISIHKTEEEAKAEAERLNAES